MISVSEQTFRDHADWLSRGHVRVVWLRESLSLGPDEHGARDPVAERAARCVHTWVCTTEPSRLRRDDTPLRLTRLDAYCHRRAGALARWSTRSFRRRLAVRRVARRARTRLVPVETG